MNLRAFSALNKARCESPDGFGQKINDWSLSDWMTAACGELGEAANIVKKLNRHRDSVPGNGDLTKEDLLEKLRGEIADTLIYLDLLASAAGISLADAVVETFNKKSLQINCGILIEAPASNIYHSPKWRPKFELDQPVRFNSKFGSIGKIVGFHPNVNDHYYVEWVYGLDVNGKVISTTGGAKSADLVPASFEDYLQIISVRSAASFAERHTE